MTIDVSVIIPHKPTRDNDKALRMAIDSILKESYKHSIELIVNTVVPGDPYVIWNHYAYHAIGDTLVFTNSDVVFAEGWLSPLLEQCKPNTIVCGYLVEPKNIGVAPVNIERDFGKTVDAFDRAAFEQWIKEREHFEAREERGWYMPCAMNRKWFNETPGFDTLKEFPYPNDSAFWEMCISRYNTKLIRVPSYSYHFQALSSRP